MIEILRDPMWQFIGVLIALLALIISILLWMQRKRKALSYEIVSRTPLLSFKEKIKGNLQILFDGREVQDVHLIEVRMFNSGNESIKSEDYERPINFSFGENAQVLTAEVVEANPESIHASADIVDTKVKLKPILLNGSDSFTLKMLVSQYSGEEKDIKIDGRVAGVKDISMPVEGRFYILTMASGFLLSLIGMIGILTRTPPASPSPPPTLGEMSFSLIFLVGYILLFFSFARRKKNFRNKLLKLFQINFNFR